MVNLPDFFTSFVATSARLFNTFMHSDFLICVSDARASAMPVFVRGLAPFIAVAFIAFIGAISEMLNFYLGEGSTERCVQRRRARCRKEASGYVVTHGPLMAASSACFQGGSLSGRVHNRNDNNDNDNDKN